MSRVVAGDEIARDKSGDWRPLVSVVVATKDRPVLLRRALKSFLAQTYEQMVEIIVVFDQDLIDDLADVRAENPRAEIIRTIRNDRTPGLAGARNSGISVARGELIAFCDDDDEWLTEKLSKQVELWSKNPDAVCIGTGMRIEYEGGARVREAPERVGFTELLDSRVFSIPSSGLLLKRDDFFGRVGLVDEELPSSYGEDWDLMLRLTRFGDIVNVPDPIVIVHWNRPSFFTEKWNGIARGIEYLLQKYPEFDRSRKGKARMASQIAFARAALGERRSTVHWAGISLRRNPAQVRAWAALAVGARLVSADQLVTAANKRGRGL